MASIVGEHPALESINKTYDPIFPTEDDEVRVVARFVEVLRGEGAAS